MPVLSNLELFEKIEQTLEAKFDVKFQQLYEEIHDLKGTNKKLIDLNCALIKQIHELKDHSNDASNIELSVELEDSNLDAVEEEPKKHYDLLIISDSIYRHVGVPCPKGVGLPTAVTNLLGCSTHLPKTLKQEFSMLNLNCLKVVVPGALAPRLLQEATLLHRDCSFSHIVVNCGANYVPHPDSQRPMFDWQGQAIHETIFLLSFLQTEICESVAFSSILPQPRNAKMTGCINTINLKISHFCVQWGMEEINHSYFARFGKINAGFFARDGIHLNFSGVDKLFHSLENHVKFVLSYDFDTCEW